jgi:hypothetical protein
MGSFSTGGETGGVALLLLLPDVTSTLFPRMLFAAWKWSFGEVREDGVGVEVLEDSSSELSPERVRETVEEARGMEGACKRGGRGRVRGEGGGV